MWQGRCDPCGGLRRVADWCVGIGDGVEVGRPGLVMQVLDVEDGDEMKGVRL